MNIEEMESKERELYTEFLAIEKQCDKKRSEWCDCFTAIHRAKATEKMRAEIRAELGDTK